MQLTAFSPVTGAMSSFEAQALLLDDPRVHPAEDALQQLGHALMNEVLDAVPPDVVARIGGRWQITNKTYAHTGGQPPSR